MTFDILDTATRVLIVVGALLLAGSLRPAWLIHRHSLDTGRPWKVLFYLIVFFIGGYAGVAWLIAPPIGVMELIVAAVLFAGSCFVVIVMRLSLATIRRLAAFAAEERYRALHDELTELPNRTLFAEHIERTISGAPGRGRRSAVFIMDLDRFKEINDTLGHYYGDQLLKRIAPRLRAEVGDSAMVARLGGDEFGVFLAQTEGPEESIQLAGRILRALEQSIWVEGHQLNVNISIGIAFFPDDGRSSDQLIKKADVAMYLAKQRNVGFMVYDPSQDQHTITRLALMGDLRRAIERQALQLHFQPQVNIKTGRVDGVEALVRWQHPEQGLIPCTDFISLAEQTGVIRPLTQWVLNAALCQYAQWVQAGVTLTISINLSVKNFQEPDFVHNIEQALKRWNVPPHRLRLEIVESAMMQDPHYVRRIILQLSALGVLFSIDDFGTGYSSLAYLKQMPVSEIKIDKSFVAEMATDEDSGVIVRAIIDLAHNVGLKVTAEGVENRDVLDLLEILRCDTAQGNHVSPALSSDELLEWLDARRQHHSQGGGA